MVPQEWVKRTDGGNLPSIVLHQNTKKHQLSSFNFAQFFGNTANHNYLQEPHQPTIIWRYFPIGFNSTAYSGGFGRPEVYVNDTFPEGGFTTHC